VLVRIYLLLIKSLGGLCVGRNKVIIVFRKLKRSRGPSPHWEDEEGKEENTRTVKRKIQAKVIQNV
jgi:hypothetical protein